MSRLIETICLENGRLRNVGYHERRMRESGKKLFGVDSYPDLQALAAAQNPPQTGMFRLRIVYAAEVLSCQVIPHSRPSITSLKIVYDDGISYADKFENRSSLDRLYSQRGPCDEIIIIKNGFVTDALIANLVFKEGSKWVTPKTFLLNGTMRQFLLEKKIITEADIRVEDISRYERIKLINCMLAFDGPEVDVKQTVN